jgi:hypothetical protein
MVNFTNSGNKTIAFDRKRGIERIIDFRFTRQRKSILARRAIIILVEIPGDYIRRFLLADLRTYSVFLIFYEKIKIAVEK